MGADDGSAAPERRLLHRSWGLAAYVVSDIGDAIPLMDPLLSAAAAALASVNPLRALNLVALRDDTPALALRGIAMAQLGDLRSARKLLQRASRGFAPHHPVAHARCVVAQSEIAFANRELDWPVDSLEAAQIILERHGDELNAVHARHLKARRALLLGQLDGAEKALGGLDPSPWPAPRRAVHEMILAGLALMRLRPEVAAAAITRAHQAAEAAGIPALREEVAEVARRLEVPSARLVTRFGERLLRLQEVADLLASDALIVDACRRSVRRSRTVVSLASRPVLFSLARTLAETWPGAVPRASLLRAAFGARRVDDSHRARLRVEIGRLRRLLLPLAEVRATPQGYALRPRGVAEVGVLAWPTEQEHGAVLAHLADREAWSSSSLALAMGVSQRTVQRSLDALAAAGTVQWFGRGRARRWTSAAAPGFTTTMLLPTLL